MVEPQTYEKPSSAGWFRSIREDFSRIQNALRVEGVLHGPHEREVMGWKSEVHVSPLHPADAVFSTQGSAESEHLAEKLADGLVDLAFPNRFGQIATQQIDVQVAIACMAITHALQTVLRTDGLHRT